LIKFAHQVSLLKELYCRHDCDAAVMGAAMEFVQTSKRLSVNKDIFLTSKPIWKVEMGTSIFWAPNNQQLAFLTCM
jgi:hypothetical protein